MPDQSPVFSNATSVTNASGNVAAAAAAANLPAAAGKITYLSGVTVTGLGATAATTATLTIGGLLSGPLTVGVAIPAGATVPITPHNLFFMPALPGSAPNTAITVSVASFGAGNTNASCAAWGFQV